MTTSRPPLLARLRRRLVATTWLFVLLVVAKAGVAMACAADGVVQRDASEHSALLVEAPQASANSSDADACWHEGSGGCHCACAHAAPMNGSRASIASVAAAVVEFPATHAQTIFARREPALRPPIA